MRNKEAMRRAGAILRGDHIGSRDARDKVKAAYLRFLTLRKAEGLAARADQLIAKVNEEIGLKHGKPTKQRCKRRTWKKDFRGLMHYWHLLEIEPLNPYAEFRNAWPEIFWRSYLCSARENNTWLMSPFCNAAQMKLIRGAVERVINIENLKSDTVVTNFFPLDTTEATANRVANLSLQAFASDPNPDRLSHVAQFTHQILELFFLR